jgi:tRNA-5-taurinomethyluridine 2-sulfurtransferase
MKIAILISGGVDSSVALRLLKDQGHQLEAFYLKIWLEDELAYLGTCPWQEDLAYVEQVCAQADVPLHVISLQKEYWQHVVAYTISEVQAGRTPSPDLLCNQRIKFGCFLEHIDDSFEKIATGHYANISFENGLWALQKAKDPIKDQTYFLAYLNQQQLGRLMFPVGAFHKAEVRELAEKYQLPNRDRKDSQGICFLGKIKFSDFIGHHLGKQPGDLIEFETGTKLGMHDGFWYYTVGQRKGLGLSGGPWFVVKKDIPNNIVYISNKYHSEDKIRDKFSVESLHWISQEKPTSSHLDVKVRHGEHVYNALLRYQPDNRAVVTLNGNDQGLAPGQFAVFYDGQTCLGCGVIAESNE